MPLTFRMSGMKGSRDERGLIAVTVPFFTDDFSTVLSVGSDFSAFGLPETGRTWGDIENEQVGWQVDVTFSGSQVEEGERTYDFDSSFGDEPIESHPDLDSLKRAYKGTVDAEGKIKFAEKLAANSTSGLGGGRASKNPMFGTTSYLALKSVFRQSYVKRNITDALISSIGSIRNSLPGGLPTPPEHDWLVMPPKIRRIGNTYEIAEEWLMSSKGGWPKEVYKLIQA